jgi:hypothetical protein
VPFLTTGLPIAEIGNTAVKDVIGKILGNFKQICFPHCGLSCVTASELMNASHPTHTVWRCTLSQPVLFKQSGFGIQDSLFAALPYSFVMGFDFSLSVLP